MRRFIQIILTLGLLLGVVTSISSFIGASVAGLTSVGGVLTGLLLIFAFGGLLYYSVMTSPQQLKARSKLLEVLGSCNEGDMSTWLGDFLPKRFLLNRNELEVDLIDSGVTKADISSVLDELCIDYKLPISSDDTDAVATAIDIINLVNARRTS